jgi:hypothetical protein
MAVLKEVDNLPAGTAYKPGDNADLDAAIANGTLTGVTVGADGNYVLEDGNPITSAGGTTTVADLSNATAEDMANIAAAADLVYLSQNTGVNTADLNAAYQALGIDPNDTTAHTKLNDVLDAAGYNPGSNETFYGNTGGPADVGAQILYERWQNAPTEQDLIDAGYDPAEYNVINSNAANAFYLEEKMKEKGLSADQTAGKFGSTAKYFAGDASPFGPDYQGAQNVQDVREGWEKYGVKDETSLDIYEWDLIKKKKEEKPADTTPKVGDTGITTGGVGTGTPGGGISGGFTADPNTLDIPSTAVLPTFTNSVSEVSDGASGTYTVPAQTFQQNVTDQVSDFQTRAAEQQQFYQPQTMAEKQAAGEDVASYAISQKLYRNPNTGHQLFIPFQGDQPLQAIPAGYYEINQQTGAMAAGAFNPLTAGGNTYTTGANSGGYIQGFSGEDGSTTIPNPSPIDPNQIYGNVSFQDPVTGQTVTQTPEEYFQSLANKQAQATFNPATSVTMPGVSTMAELGYEYNADGTIKLDPTTGQPVVKELMPGTVLESTAGQASGLAPVIGKRQATDASGNLMFDAAGQPIMVGADPAQVGDVVQAKGPGTPAIYDEAGNLVSAAVDIPGAAQVGLTTAAPGVATQLQGGTTTNYQGMADAVPGATWDVTTGTFTLNGVQYTPDQFIQANNLSVGDFMTTTGGLQAAQMVGGPSQTITGQTADTTMVSGLEGATGQSVDVTGAPTRTEQVGEMVEGTGVDQAAVQAAFGAGEVQAASVQDELAGLMQQFEGGDTPAWAAGSMRKATQMLAARGLGASSMAGQAVIQAAMEAALPIAQIDAGNKQQMALFKAEQRAKFLQMDFDQAFQAKVINAAKISEIANMNFSAEQQIALENSRAANTMNLQNLSNKQALIMAEAAALSQLDMANLSNLQQAQVQNAQNFLQIDMANLSNSQSTALFKAQQVTNAMLSDAAQANASAQFNATSQNQTNQFFSNLAAQVSQFNAAQQNAINQFNAEEVNALLEFNSALQNQREMFNAQNYLVVAQANAQWRQNINTANTEAQNVANLTYAKEVNGLTQKALDDYWQKERDIMSYAFAQSEGAADRAIRIMLGNMDLDALRTKLDFAEDNAKAEFWSDLIFGDMSFSDVFKLPKKEED